MRFAPGRERGTKSRSPWRLLRGVVEGSRGQDYCERVGSQPFAERIRGPASDYINHVATLRVIPRHSRVLSSRRGLVRRNVRRIKLLSRHVERSIERDLFVNILVASRVTL